MNKQATIIKKNEYFTLDFFQRTFSSVAPKHKKNTRKKVIAWSYHQMSVALKEIKKNMMMHREGSVFLLIREK